MTQRFMQQMGDTCSLVEAGTIFRLFDAKCTKYLFNYKYNGGLAPADMRNKSNPYKWNVARSNRRSTWVGEESSHQVEVCDIDNAAKPFAKKHFMLRMKCKPPTRCPYDKKTYISVSSVYSEAVNSAFTVTSPVASSEQLWDGSATTLSFSMSPPSIGDPFDFGSSGTGACSVDLRISDPNPDSTCSALSIEATFHLSSLGLAWDFLAGTPETQVRPTGCEALQHGAGLYAFWTGVARPRGPIGLVMVLDCTIRGRSE